MPARIAVGGEVRFAVEAAARAVELGGELVPTQAAAEMPGGRLGGVVLELAAAERLEQLDHRRIVDLVGGRHHLVRLRRRRIAQAVVEAEEGHVDLPGLFGRNAEEAAAAAAT